MPTVGNQAILEQGLEDYGVGKPKAALYLKRDSKIGDGDKMMEDLARPRGSYWVQE